MTNQIDTGTDELLCSLDERVALITLNRPERKNALSDNLTPALRQTLFELNTNQEVGCIVITGAGNAFCAGGDVSGMGSGSNTETTKKPPTVQDRVNTLQHKQETLTLRLFEHAKPTIASLPGPAVGAGMCIALACDIRVGAESAFIGTGYRNVGFSGDYGGSWLLTQLVGVAKAKELFFTGQASSIRRMSCIRSIQSGGTGRSAAESDYGTCETNCIRPSHRNWLHEGKYKQSSRTGLARGASSGGRQAHALCGNQ